MRPKHAGLVVPFQFDSELKQGMRKKEVSTDITNEDWFSGGENKTAM